MRILRFAISAAVVATLIVATGFVSTALLRGRTPPAAAGSAAPDPTAGGPEVALQLPGEVYQLTYDPERDALWFAVMDPGMSSWVYRFDIATAKTNRWELPTAPGNGFLSEVRLASDGAVWVSEDYALARLVPESGQMTSLELDAKVPDALPDNPTLPGTWVSAFASDGTGALVARTGVPYLTRLSSDLKVVEKVPVPDGFAGARDVAVLPGGPIALLSGWSQSGQIAVLDPTGKQLSMFEAVNVGGNSRIAVDSAGAMVISETPSTSYTAAGTSSALLTGQTVNLSAVAADPISGVVAYDEVAGKLYRIDEGQLTGTVALPATSVTVMHGGQTFRSEAPAYVRAMTVDKHGATWLIVGRDRTLERAQL
jgi:streptogramin lyase